MREDHKKGRKCSERLRHRVAALCRNLHVSYVNYYGECFIYRKGAFVRINHQGPFYALKSGPFLNKNGEVRKGVTSSVLLMSRRWKAVKIERVVKEVTKSVEHVKLCNTTYVENGRKRGWR